MFGQAAAMRIHVADRDFARDPGIEHGERGIEHAQFESQVIFPSPTSSATTVEPIGLDSDAS